MRLDKIVAAIPGKNRAQREQMRKNAELKLKTGSDEQKDAASIVLEALDAQEDADRARIASLPLAQLVAEAFRLEPPSDAEEKALRALLDHPGATSGHLSEVCNWGGLSWHLHFAEIGRRREHLLWPATPSQTRDAEFWCGILADFDFDGSRWTMKPEVVAGLDAIGIKAAIPA